VVDAVFDLAPIAVVLAFDAGRVMTAFGDARFIDAADRLGVSMLGHHQPLAFIAQHLFVPHDRFEESLQGSGSDILLQGHRLHVLPLHVGEQSLHIDEQQQLPFSPSETVSEPS